MILKRVAASTAALTAGALVLSGCLAGTSPSREAVANESWVFHLGLGFVQGALAPFMILAKLINNLTDGGLGTTPAIIESQAIGDPAYMGGYLIGVLFLWSFWWLSRMPAFKKKSGH